MAEITIAELAQSLEVTPQRLRKFLRDNFPRNERGSRYAWPENSIELEKIREAVKKGGSQIALRSKRGRIRNRDSTKSRRRTAIGAYDPEPEPQAKPCLWCGGQVSLLQIYVKPLPNNEDQKIAVYRCRDCEVESEIVLTLPGWKAGVGYIG